MAGDAHITRMTKAEAQLAYRQAWCVRCLATTQDQRVGAEKVMDAVQPHCVDNGRPGPEWDAFIATLPGFVEFWQRFRRECIP